jgi:hypothetical protein
MIMNAAAVVGAKTPKMHQALTAMHKSFGRLSMAQAIRISELHRFRRYFEAACKFEFKTYTPEGVVSRTVDLSL